MRIIKDSITIDELKKLAEKLFGEMIKAVVDVEKQLVAVDAELHSDLEALLLSEGSNQKDLWGVNLYPDLSGEGFVEFDSMINLRPSQGNRSRGVDSVDVQRKVIEIVGKRIGR